MSIVKSSTIPTLSSYYRSGNLAGTILNNTISAANAKFNTQIAFTRCNIVNLDTTCIVNAANTHLTGGSGVNGAIQKAAGPELLKHCSKLGGCETGSAKMTDSFNLPSKYIIHAVGPMYHVEKNKGVQGLEKTRLASCYKTALNLAKSVSTPDDKASIAFPCLSTGIYGYPSEKAAKVALYEVRRWLEEEGKDSLGSVVFVLFEEKDLKAYETWLPRVFPPSDKDIAAAGLKARPWKREEGAKDEEWEKVESPVSGEKEGVGDGWLVLEASQEKK